MKTIAFTALLTGLVLTVAVVRAQSGGADGRYGVSCWNSNNSNVPVCITYDTITGDQVGHAWLPSTFGGLSNWPNWRH